MANTITDDNIHTLVREYINNRNRLPIWLRGIPIGNWDVSRVTNMGGLFEDCANFNEPLDNWNVSRVRDMDSMFNRCEIFNQPLENWNVSNVTNMSSMFSGCTNFNQPLNNWNVSSVRNMVYMFSDCVNFNQPLDNWNVSQVIEMRYMFENCRSFNQDLSNWNISRVRSMVHIFRGCTSLTINPNWQINQMVLNIESMFVNTPLEGTVLQRAAAPEPGPLAPRQQPPPQPPQQQLPPQPPPQQPRQQPQLQPQGLAHEIHNAFADLDLPKFMTIIRRENNGASNFKNYDNVLKPLVTKYIATTKGALSAEEKSRFRTDINGLIGQNVADYIAFHPEVKDNTLEVIQFVLSQDPKYKDLYLQTFQNECMGGYSTGNRQSCTKGMFERIYMANKGTIEGLCFDELQGSTSAASSTSSCKPVYLELYSTFTPGADIDINEIFQKWYNQFSYDAIPEEENPLKNLSVDARKQHFRDFVRQDLTNTPRIWQNSNFQRKLEQSIQSNNIIFQTLNSDAGLGGRRKRRNRKTKRKSLRKGKDKRKTVRKDKRKTKRR